MQGGRHLSSGSSKPSKHPSKHGKMTRNLAQTPTSSELQDKLLVRHPCQVLVPTLTSWGQHYVRLTSCLDPAWVHARVLGLLRLVA